MIWELYVLLFLIGLGSLFLGVMKKHLLPLFLAVIIFSVLAFSGFTLEYISNGTTIKWTEPAFIYLSWLLMFVAFIFILAGAVSMLKDKKGGERNIRMGF
jgi:uncharacterized membrane protein